MADIMSGEIFRESLKRSWGDVWVRAVAAGCVLYAGYIALRYASQTPLDAYAFRQAQTALSAYWLMLNGFSFSYETPVAGPAWSIPFEFPVYQFMTALVAKATGVSLDAVGRVLSFVFLILCLVPARSIVRLLGLPRSVFYSFVALLFSSPLYIYWGRSFMIETAALFFTIVAVKYFCEMVVDGYSRRSAGLYLLFMSLGLLQKATTALPMLFLLAASFTVVEVGRSGSVRQFLFGVEFRRGVVYFAVPLAIGALWTGYTDYVKSFNTFAGTQLTSAALSKWNWGSLHQRFSSELFVKVLWERILVNNLAGVFGLALILFGVFSKCLWSIRWTVVLAVLAAVIPLFLFTNLHIVHEYYQTANLIYLIFAVAVVLGAILSPLLGGWVLAASVTLIVSSNIIVFMGGYFPQAKAIFSNSNSMDYAVGKILRREVPVGKQFVAFGNDWSSTIAYVAQRKSFNVPAWFSLSEEISKHPERFVDEAQLGAVVNCRSEKPGLAGLLKWSSGRTGWKIGEVHGCYVVTPEKTLATEQSSMNVQCEGSVDRAVVERRDGEAIISLAGWTTMSEGRGTVPDAAFFTLEKSGMRPVHLEALKIPRGDVNTYLEISDDIDVGLSRIASLDLQPGEYVVSITQAKDGKFEACQFRGKLVVDGSI